MGDHRQDLAMKIVADYRTYGIPAKVHRGKVLFQRDGEWVGPFDPEKHVNGPKAEVDRLRIKVWTKLETYGIVDYLMNGTEPGLDEKINLLAMMELAGRGVSLPWNLAVEGELIERLRADADFAAYAVYWTIAWLVLREFIGRDGT